MRAFCSEKKINPSLLSRWRSSINKITTNKSNNKKNGGERKSLYPDIEEIVFSKLIEARNFGTPINYSWIRKCSVDTYRTLKPNNEEQHIPMFSNMWIRNFLSRFDLTVRKASSQRIEKIQILN